MFPVVAPSGLKVMSMAFLLDSIDTPIIWRGPQKTGAIKQLISDAYWGELDYLLVDMPPGTGDVPLTVFQSLPIDGIVVVTSPQDLVKLIVKKAYNMAVKMDIPVLGLVENYSYIECPDCKKKINVFGQSKIDEIAAELGVDVLAKLPIVPKWAELADAGEFEDTDNPYMDGIVEVLK